MTTSDIELERTSDNTFDWVFTDTDVETGIGARRLRSSVIHQLGLRRGELDMAPYSEKGGDVYKYLKAKNSDTNMQYLKEAVIACVKEVTGIEEVEVELERVGDSVVIEAMTILYKGNEVDIGAI